jgi:glycosyltransferase involved in cell wall biosynthesis
MTDASIENNPRAPHGERALGGNVMVARPRKIAFVQTQAENAGAQEIARQLALGAERQGFATRQVFLFRRTDAFDGEANAHFCACKRPSSPLGLLKLFYELYKELRREAPDAVLMFQHYGNLIAAPIARLAGVPLVIANQVSSADSIPAPVRLADRLMGQMRFYDHIVVNSAVTQAAYAAYPPAYARRVTRIDHGFFDKSSAIEKTEARRALGLPLDAELLGCAARLHAAKQLDLAIRLLPLNERQHLALAGQGAERASLEALARELNVFDRVHFVGELDARGMGLFLAALDCFVFPSATETFGLAPVEAAQAGVPVVANNIEVLNDVLCVDGEPCALFVDARDTQVFAAAVRRALDDAETNAALTRSGRRLATRYPLDKMVDDYLRLIEPKAA